MNRRLPEFLKHQVRGLVRHRKRVVEIGDVLRTEPLSRKFGFDRGLPIDRYYVEQFLRSRADRLRGDLLEVGETRYSREFATAAQTFSIISIDPDVVVKAGVTGDVLIADLRDTESLPEARFDCFVQTQVLNFTDDPAAVLAGSMRLLRPGGVLLGTVSSISQVSQFDTGRWGDYWRFTPRGLEALVGRETGCAAEVTSFGNFAAARAFLDGMAVEDFPRRALLDEHDPQYPVLISYELTKPA